MKPDPKYYIFAFPIDDPNGTGRMFGPFDTVKEAEEWAQDIPEMVTRNWSVKVVDDPGIHEKCRQWPLTIGAEVRPLEKEGDE